jgi:hypothetical protein
MNSGTYGMEMPVHEDFWIWNSILYVEYYFISQIY